jgi:hypothetical protein
MTRNSRNHNARVRKSQTSVRKRSGVKRTRRRGGRTHTHTTRTKRIGGVLNADLLKNPDWKLYNIPTPLGDANVENKEYVVSKKGVVSRLRIGYIRNSTLTNMSPIPVVFLLHNGINSRDVVSGIYPVVDPTKNSTSSSSFVVVKDTSGSSRGLTINKLDINQDTGVVKPVSKSWFASENTISLLFQSTDIRNDVFNRLQILSESAPSPEQLEQLTELVNINVPNSYNRVQNAMHNVSTGAVDSFKNVAHDLTQGKIDVANTAKGALLGVGTVGAAGAAAVAGATAVSGAIAKGVLVDGLLKGTVNNMQSLQARVQQNPNRVAELTQYSVEDIVKLLNDPHFRAKFELEDQVDARTLSSQLMAAAQPESVQVTSAQPPLPAAVAETTADLESYTQEFVKAVIALHNSNPCAEDDDPDIIKIKNSAKQNGDKINTYIEAATHRYLTPHTIQVTKTLCAATSGTHKAFTKLNATNFPDTSTAYFIRVGNDMEQTFTFKRVTDKGSKYSKKNQDNPPDSYRLANTDELINLLQHEMYRNLLTAQKYVAIVDSNVRELNKASGTKLNTMKGDHTILFIKSKS